MKKMLAIVLGVMILFSGLPAWASDGMEASYVSGTVPTTKLGATGMLDSTKPDVMEFHSSSGDFSIPYTRITAARYHEENRFRLGVLPAIAVGLLKARSKRHIVTITWKDEKELPQVARFEMSKQASMSIVTVIRVRAPQVCQPKTACVNNQFD
jgi:hypothetical protein